MATYLELAERILGISDKEFLDDMLWCQTAFPFVGPLHIARQLKSWKKSKRGGWSQCSVCGKPYRFPKSVTIGACCGYPDEGCKVMDAIKEKHA